MATPRYHAINVIRSGGIVVPPFVAESLLPKGRGSQKGGTEPGVNAEVSTAPHFDEKLVVTAQFGLQWIRFQAEGKV